MADQSQTGSPETAYKKWVQSEGIPVAGGFFIEDLNRLELQPWPRKGGKGAFVNLVGNEAATDAYVCEIAPGGKLDPQKHLYEEMIYVLSGRGATAVWVEGQPRQTFEWQEGSLFAIPINCRHQHFNGQGDKPARYVAATNAPLLMDLFHNTGFIFDVDYRFTDRYHGEQDYFGNPGKLLENRVEGMAPALETNFLPDATTAKLHKLGERGGGNYSAVYELADNTMVAHISEFAAGRYKKAHRHGPGANIIILGGAGYSLMWPEGRPWVRVPWQKGSMFVPPDRWFHQHFNTGSVPARYLALRWGSQKHVMAAIWKPDDGSAVGKDQIEDKDENPEIRRMFVQEVGGESKRLEVGDR